jgi:hypothetical protein
MSVLVAPGRPREAVERDCRSRFSLNSAFSVTGGRGFSRVNVLRVSPRRDVVYGDMGIGRTSRGRDDSPHALRLTSLSHVDTPKSLRLPAGVDIDISRV